MLWVAARSTVDLQDELDAANEKVEELEGEMEELQDIKRERDELKEKLAVAEAKIEKFDSASSVPGAVASAIDKIDRIHRDGGNVLSLKLAHNDLEKALDKWRASCSPV